MGRASPLVALVRRLRLITRLHVAVAVFAIYLVSTIFGCSGAFALLVLLTLPVVAFFGRIFQSQAQYEISDQEVGQLLVTFLGGIFPGAVLASLVEMIIAPLLAILCFYDQSDAIIPQLRSFLDEEARDNASGSPAPPHSGRLANLLMTLKIEKTFGYYLFIVLSAFLVAGLVEEATKLWLVQTKCLCNCSSSSRPARGWLCDPRRLLTKRIHHPNHHIVVVLAVTAAAVGFSFIENVGFTFAMPTFSDRLSAAVLRSLVSLPLHTVCGAMTGMRLARALLVSPPGGATMGICGSLRQKAWILGPAVFIHGTFDLQIFLVSSFVSDASADEHPLIYGALVPGVLSLAVVYVGVKLAKREWLTLETAKAQSQYETVGRTMKDGDFEADSDDDEEEDDISGPKQAARGVLLV